MIKLLATMIYNYYSNDMGNYFDFIQGNEEETYNEIIHILKHGKIKDKINLLKGGVA